MAKTSLILGGLLAPHCATVGENLPIVFAQVHALPHQPCLEIPRSRFNLKPVHPVGSTPIGCVPKYGYDYLFAASGHTSIEKC